MAAAAAAAAASVEAQSAAPFLVTSHQPTQALLNISRNVHFLSKKKSNLLKACNLPYFVEVGINNTP